MPDTRRPPLAYYGTYDEIAFLRGLGTYNKSGRNDKASFLRQYLDAMRLRQAWGHIDRMAVEREARTLLAHAEQGP